MPPDPQRRIAITGLGAAGPFGDTGGTWSALLRDDDAPLRPTADIDPTSWLPPKELRRSARFTHLAVGAAAEAVTDAGIAGPELVVDRDRCGVVVGVAYGAPEDLAAARHHVDAGEPEEVLPLLGSATCENAPAATIARLHDLRGPALAVGAASASGTVAISVAADQLRLGRVDLALAGGTQARMAPELVAAYRNLRILSPTGSPRPFDARRDGFAFSEGAALLVLEDLDHARARGAPVRAELLGSAVTNDSVDVAKPSVAAAVHCIEAALADAGVDPSAITALNAHGTGTKQNDVAEAEAFAVVFGAGEGAPPITSLKGALGHTFAAAGAFEALATVRSIEEGLVPATLVHGQQDPAIPNDVVWGGPRPMAPGPMLSLSFGLGGVVAALVIGPVRSGSR